MPKLIIAEKGSDKEQIYEFARDGVSIGRSSENSISLHDKGISRKHATITVDDNDFFLIDLGSGNGTFLNGARVKANEKVILRHGDIISIEKYNLRFSQIDEMLASSFNDITDSDILEVKLLKKVLRAIDKESIPSFEVLNGDFVGKKLFLSEDMEEVVIGREPTVDFPIEEYVMSRRHAKIINKEGQISIQDINSKNGTFLNNRRVTEEILHDGDRIALGTIVLIFRNPKEINMEAMNEQGKKVRAEEELKRELERPEGIETPEPQEGLAGEGGEPTGSQGLYNMGELAETTPDDYPVPSPRQERISLSTFEIGMIGIGLLIMIFAVVSFVNLLTK